MLKRFICLLLALSILSTSVFALAESAEEELAQALAQEEQEEETVQDEPIANVEPLPFYVENEETAKEFAKLYMEGTHVDQLYAMFDPVLAMRTAKRYFGNQLNAVESLLGKFQGFGSYRQIKNEKTITHVLYLHFEHKDEIMMLTMGAKSRSKEKNPPLDKIHGLLFAMVEKTETPNLAKEETHAESTTEPVVAQNTAFEEITLTLGQKPWAVSAILAKPKTEHVLATVLFLGDFGAYDEQETINNIPMFKQMASFLASHNIASIRFAKREYSYADVIKTLSSFTPQESLLEDATLALNALQSECPSPNLFIIAHGKSFNYLPTFIQENSIQPKGIIALSTSLGSSLESLQKAFVNALGKLQNDELFNTLQAHEEELNFANQLTSLSLDDAKDKVIFGIPATYFVWEEQHNPQPFYKETTMPLLFLQGENDEHLPLHLGQEKWKGILQGKDNATYKSYKNLGSAFANLNENTVHSSVLNDMLSFITMEEK